MSHAPSPASSGMPQRVPFAKPWRSWSDQLKSLERRGLVVSDRPTAEAFLSHVNYYRLSGYGLAFEQCKDSFFEGATFEQIKAAYDFDRVLRDLVTEALEIIEVDARTAIAYHFGQRYGAFGHTDPAKFFVPPTSRNATKAHEFEHLSWLENIQREANRSKERFVEHYKLTYTDFTDLPVWMVTEIMSFGSLSRMYKGMLITDQKVVAHRYGVQPRFLASWLHHLVYVRNICAHHSRLWDRLWAIKPELPPLPQWSRPLLPDNDHLFVSLLIIGRLLSRCPAIGPFDVEWKRRIESHLANPPTAPNPLERMGLTASWASHPFWV